jgi:3-oxoacyl-[acyl-carrier protein] reductase
LGSAGVSVVVNYATSRERAERVVSQITAQGGKAIAVQGSMAKAEDIRRLFAETKKAFGALDILVNNAGIYKFDPLETVTAEEFHRQHDVNVLGPILATQEALKYFRSEGGSVINISSVAGQNAMPGSVIYSSSKSALDSVTRVLAAELAARKIRVNAIAPGPVDTDGFVESGIKGSDMEKQMIASTPLGRLGQPADIASIAVFLASEASGWMTGERLNASGGLR